jgi:hypothetical protein
MIIWSRSRVFGVFNNRNGVAYCCSCAVGHTFGNWRGSYEKDVQRVRTQDIALSVAVL